MPSRTEIVQHMQVPKTYRGLMTWHQIRPLRSKRAYKSTMKIIDAMAGRKLTSDQSDYLGVLVVVASEYEREHLPRPDVQCDPIQILKYLLEQNDMNASDLGLLLGDRELGAKILDCKRPLRKAHITKLASRSRVHPSLFVQ